MTIPTRTITRDDALTMLRRAVDDRGETYVYPGAAEPGAAGCRYFSDETTEGKFGATADNPHPPACIVGHVLDQIGVTYDDLEDVTDERLVTPNTWGATNLLKRLDGLTVEPQAMRLLMDVQDYQDSGIAWGDAVQRADDYDDEAPDLPDYTY